MLDESVKVIMLYFSMHDCKPCLEFTPILAEIYTEMNESKKVFEVVYFSGDKTKQEFDQYFAEMPWPSMPW